MSPLVQFVYADVSTVIAKQLNSIYRCKFELKAFCWLRMLCRVHHQEYSLAVKLMYIIHVVHLAKTHNLMLLLLLLSQTHLTNKRTNHSHIVYGDTMQLVLTN